MGYFARRFVSCIKSCTIDYFEAITSCFSFKHSPSQFYLVLDVCNVTQHEMEIHYAKTKQILVEKGETCRIPVPLDRCPLSNVEKGNQ